MVWTMLLKFSLWLCKYFGVCVYQGHCVVFVSVSNMQFDMSEGNPVDNAIKCTVHM